MPKYIIPYRFLGKPDPKGVKSVIGKRRTRTVKSQNLLKAYQAMYSWSHRQGKGIHLYKGRRVQKRN